MKWRAMLQGGKTCQAPKTATFAAISAYRTLSGFACARGFRSRVQGLPTGAGFGAGFWVCLRPWVREQVRWWN